MTECSLIVLMTHWKHNSSGFATSEHILWCSCGPNSTAGGLTDEGISEWLSPTAGSRVQEETALLGKSPGSAFVFEIILQMQTGFSLAS